MNRGRTLGRSCASARKTLGNVTQSRAPRLDRCRSGNEVASPKAFLRQSERCGLAEHGFRLGRCTPFRGRNGSPEGTERAHAPRRIECETGASEVDCFSGAAKVSGDPAPEDRTSWASSRSGSRADRTPRRPSRAQRGAARRARANPLCPPILSSALARLPRRVSGREHAACLLHSCGLGETGSEMGLERANDPELRGLRGEDRTPRRPPRQDAQLPLKGSIGLV
jgi:hypothetical protein